MALNGVDTVIELGPGKVLTGLTRRIDKALRAYSVEDPPGLAIVLREVFK
jgi:[acyl-carrier-protein] S-malonyltransferase